MRRFEPERTGTKTPTKKVPRILKRRSALPLLHSPDSVMTYPAVAPLISIVLPRFTSTSRCVTGSATRSLFGEVRGAAHPKARRGARPKLSPADVQDSSVLPCPARANWRCLPVRSVVCSPSPESFHLHLHAGHFPRNTPRRRVQRADHGSTGGGGYEDESLANTVYKVLWYSPDSTWVVATFATPQ